MPPRESKSTTAAVLGTLLALARNPDTRIILASYADELAEKHSREARRLINDHGELLGLALSADKSSAGQWTVAGRRGGLLASGILSGITGHGTDGLLIVDVSKGQGVYVDSLRDTLAGQMLGKRLPDRPSAFERDDAGGVGDGDLGGEVILAGVGFEVFELELHLLEQAAAALGTRTVLLAPELCDLQFEVRDDRLDGALAGNRIGGARLGFVGALQGGDEQHLERFDIVRKGRNHRGHGRE